MESGGWKFEGSRMRVEGSGLRVQGAKTPSVESWAETSHTMYWLDGIRKSIPPQDCQLVVLISNSKQKVDGFVKELTF